jgi:hypothetical protein
MRARNWQIPKATTLNWAGNISVVDPNRTQKFIEMPNFATKIIELIRKLISGVKV